MTTVTMVEFRRHAQRIIRRVQQGEGLILTYRGRPSVRIEPITDEKVREDDPIYMLAAQADDSGRALSNAEMDEVVYGN